MKAAKYLFIIVLIGMGVGLTLGALGVWVDHWSNSLPGPEKWRWTDLLVAPSIPGNIIAWHQAGGYDWGYDEDWNYKWPIIMWNGCFWGIVFVVVMAIFKIKTLFRSS